MCPCACARAFAFRSLRVRVREHARDCLSSPSAYKRLCASLHTYVKARSCACECRRPEEAGGLGRAHRRRYSDDDKAQDVQRQGPL
eukprot:2811219-Pleurochrysis_carterae.AAC.1